MLNSTELKSFDERRDISIPGNTEETLRFAVEHWIRMAQDSIAARNRFAVALSGGSTPKAIYQALSEQSERLDWSKVWLFWSDERSVPPDHPDSNYFMAMQSLSRLPITQIFRMEAEKEIEGASERYEALIRKKLGSTFFDLVMLGIGVDGHTASLFPNTSALRASDRLVVANHIPEKRSWRMTLTIPCINQSWKAVIYALGSSKETIVTNVLQAPRISSWPASQIGTAERKALWILDRSAAHLLQ